MKIADFGLSPVAGHHAGGQQARQHDGPDVPRQAGAARASTVFDLPADRPYMCMFHKPSPSPEASIVALLTGGTGLHIVATSRCTIRV